MSLGMVSCAGDDDCTPSGADRNLFAVAADDNSEDAALRRQFFADNGVYLMFNDTLRHEYVGKDAFGDDVYDTETIDFSYNITGSNTSQYKIEYCSTMEEKEICAKFVEDYIMPHFKGGSLCPYSFFLVKSIQMLDWGSWEEQDFVSTVRTMALPLGDIMEMDEDEKGDKAAELCALILKNQLPYNDKRLDPFHAISYDYTGYYLDEIIDGWNDDEHTEEEGLEIVRSYGFLSLGGWSSWKFPYFGDDYDDFFDLVLTTSEEEVNEMYGDYPLILSKYIILRDIITSLGYKF